MTSSLLIAITTIAYLVSVLLFFAFIVSRVNVFGLAGRAIASCGLMLQTAAIGLRWHESYAIGIIHAPLYNQYESLVFFSWTIVIIYLLLDRRFRYLANGAFIMPFALLGVAWAHLGLYSGFMQLVPAQQSKWLLAHVITNFLGYAAFTVASGLSIMYLTCERAGAPSTARQSILPSYPPVEVLEDLNYRAIMVGVPLLTLAIVTRAVWAKYAFGTYWSWELKEIWSMIVWFVYAAIIHCRITRGWKGRRAAWLSVIGFAVTIFCYLGIPLITPGLRNYGG